MESVGMWCVLGERQRAGMEMTYICTPQLPQPENNIPTISIGLHLITESVNYSACRTDWWSTGSGSSSVPITIMVHAQSN